MKRISDTDYTINNYSVANEEYHSYDTPEDEEGVALCMPFRLSIRGAPNIRGQSIESYYKIILGDQRC